MSSAASSAGFGSSKVRHRSEIDIAANAVWSLFEGGMLKPDPFIIRQAAKLAGLQIGDLREAKRRFEDGRPTGPRDVAVLEVLEAEHEEQVKRVLQSRVASQLPSKKRRKSKEPVRGFRICRICKELLPYASYRIKTRRNDRRGEQVQSFESACRECEREYQRQRYLSVKRAAAAETILQFFAREGDGCIGDICPVCAAPFLVGEELVTDDVRLRHSRCVEHADDPLAHSEERRLS